MTGAQRNSRRLLKSFTVAAVIATAIAILLGAFTVVGLYTVVDGGSSRGDVFRLVSWSLGFIFALLLAAFGLLFMLMRAAVRQMETAQRELETAAVTDALTGLANRRYLMSRAAEECARIPRQRGRAAVKVGVGFIMADIDSFKAINDTHGHLAGDDVLRGIAERARRVTRRYDIVGRYGGDEFLLVVPGTDFDETGSVAERLWQTVRDEPFVVAGANARVTVSVGFTCAEDDDVTSALRRADEALYRAKHAGRDRVTAL